jgi:hypothetical protein
MGHRELGPYDDEESKLFYEDLPDLLATLPAVRVPPSLPPSLPPSQPAFLTPPVSSVHTLTRPFWGFQRRKRALCCGKRRRGPSDSESR